MKIICLPVTVMQENVYFYYDDETKSGVVIDPGGESNRLCQFITERGLKIEGILLTHSHFDHVLAVHALKEATSAPIVCHTDEAAMLRSVQLGYAGNIEADLLLNDNDVFTFDGHKIQLIHTPGHTPGGASYYAEESAALFSGDTLFYDSVGRTDFPGGDHDALRSSIRDKLFALPDDTAVYPGHGESTSIGYEKLNNPFVRF